jgi:penicillin-binding protein 1A
MSLPFRQRGVALLMPLLLGGGAVLLAGALLLLTAVVWLYPQLPSLDAVLNYNPRQPLQVLTSDGVSIAQFGSERRQFVPIEQMPRRMQDALLAVEDSRFREHGGIDFHGLARAVIANLTPGGMRQGASTITQQVARTFFLSTRRTFERKGKEALLALKLEKQLSKDQILELYMNQIYLGQRSYGFAAAAQTYFGKPLDQLTIGETAMLAGLPQNPLYANPITNPARAKARQAVVLQRMVAVEMITPAEAEAAKAEKLQIRSPLKSTLHAEHVAEMARQAVYERFGEQAYTQGYKVVTSLRSAEQDAAYDALRKSVLDHDRRQPYRGPEDRETLPAAGSDEEDTAIGQALKDHRDDEDLRLGLVLGASPKAVTVRLASGETVALSPESLRWAASALSAKAAPDLALTRGAVVRVTEQTSRKNGTTWSLAQWPDAEAAYVSLDPHTGRVRALVGGFDFARRQFNHVTQAWRQPGSSFKPFLYSAALEHGVMPQTVVNDAPLDNNGDLPQGWDPQNSDGVFDGPIPLRTGLAKSKNLVSIRVLQQIGTGTALDWVQHFGFDRAKQPDNLSLALGAGSTTPLQLAQAYAVLANGGYRVDPVVIERITDAKGTVVYEAPPPAPLDDSRRVVPARNVFVMDSLLNEVTRSGTAARAQAALGRPDLYGKTGTTNDAVDAWFAGFQPSVVGVAWMGYDTPRSLGSRESGGGLALPIWIGAMRTALKGVPVAPLEAPEGVAQVDGDWRYAEYADGGFVASIGVPKSPLEQVTEPIRDWFNELFNRPKAASAP